VPLVRPVTVASRAPVVVAVIPPGVAVTVYLVTGLPLPAAACQETTAWRSRARAVTPVGAPGVAGVSSA
jgi:hypothetical protein